MDIELRQIRQLIAIAEAGSYRAAAEQLRIAQPALSVSIRKLERAVGVPLLVRNSQGAQLTEAGTALLLDGRHAVTLAGESVAKARLAAAGETGTVRIGFVGSAVYRLLPTILPAFRARHQNIMVDLREGATVDLLQEVANRHLDCAIVRGPLPSNADLDVVELEQDRLVALLRADHPRADQASIELAALSDEPFVLFSRRTVPGLRAAVDAICARAGFVPHAAQEVTQSITMVGLVSSGIGVALSPGVIANMSGPQVRFVPLAGSAGQWPLSLLAVRSRRNPSRALDLLWGCLAREG